MNQTSNETQHETKYQNITHIEAKRWNEKN